MQPTPDKATGSTYTADEFQEGLNRETQNFVENSGQTLDAGDQFQMARAAAIFAAGSQFYDDIGAANAYDLTPVDFKEAPDAYFDGMEIRFDVANSNTGASTVDVNSIGTVNLKRADGTVLQNGDIVAGERVEFSYFDSSSEFRLINTKASGSPFNTVTAQTTDASDEILTSEAVAVGKLLTISGVLSAINTSTGDRLSWNVICHASNIAGTTSGDVEPSVGGSFVVEGTADTLTARAIANDTTDVLEFTVNGNASETWDWKMTYRAEVTP